MDKYCVTCDSSKNIEEFDKNKSKSDGYNFQCKICRKISTKKYYEKNKKIIRARIKKFDTISKNKTREFIVDFLLNNPCVDCNEKDILVLEFDHIENKLYNIGDMLSRKFSIPNIKKEIAKCEVRCANCHRRKTLKALGCYRLLRE